MDEQPWKFVFFGKKGLPEQRFHKRHDLHLYRRLVGPPYIFHYGAKFLVFLSSRLLAVREKYSKTSSVYTQYVWHGSKIVKLRKAKWAYFSLIARGLSINWRCFIVFFSHSEETRGQENQKFRALESFYLISYRVIFSLQRFR